MRESYFLSVIKTSSLRVCLIAVIFIFSVDELSRLWRSPETHFHVQNMKIKTVRAREREHAAERSEDDGDRCQTRSESITQSALIFC